MPNEDSKKEELPMDKSNKEESKKDEMAIKVVEKPIEVKDKLLPTDLPVLNEVPMFKGMPLICEDELGRTCFNT